MKPHRNNPYEGFFITIEGGDGSGKTLLADSLTDALRAQGYQLLHTREPGGSGLSEHIRGLLLNPDSKIQIGERAELLLFLSARSQHIEEVIAPALHRGEIVICERFHDSSIAYQGCARHMGMAYVEKLCDLACFGFSPDATLFLDLDPALGLARVKKGRRESLDRLELEKLQFHQEVRQGYLHLADAHPERIAILDATQSPDAVLKMALEALKPRLPIKR